MSRRKRATARERVWQSIPAAIGAIGVVTAMRRNVFRARSTIRTYASVPMLTIVTAEARAVAVVAAQARYGADIASPAAFPARRLAIPVVHQPVARDGVTV